MSSWRFSSFFKGIWTAYFGWTLCSYSSRPQGRPRALFVALQWGLRPTHQQLCLAEEGAAPGTGQRCSLSPASAKFLFALCSRHRCGRPCLPLKGTWNFF